MNKTYTKTSQRNLENFFEVVSKDIWLPSTIFFKF